MSNRTTRQKLIRRLQRLAEDELGLRPKLRTCANIVDGHDRLPGSPEEQAAALFLAHREQLLTSAQDRARGPR